MIESFDDFSYKLRLAGVSLLIVACLLVLPFLLRLVLVTPKVQAAAVSPVKAVNDKNLRDSPNIMTRGMFGVSDGIGHITSSTQETINQSMSLVADGAKTATESTVSATLGSGRFVIHGIGSSAGFAGHSLAASGSFVARAAGSAFGIVPSINNMGSIIKPAEADNTPVPVINADAPDPASTQKNGTISSAAPTPQNNSEAQWPMHGVITLEFGVSDWPFEMVHTGIDISDGRLGVTPLHPFKPGTVVQVVHSGGLGNHVVVDHGGGVMSVYGHMSSTAVGVGQQVNKSFVLGYEGSTGASTGPHLHFEIRLNGQPENPHRYIDGRP